MNKYLSIFFLCCLLGWGASAEAQGSGQLAFNQAANYFIEGQNQQALQTVNSALRKFPNDAKLKALKEKLEQQQEQQKQQEKEKEEKEEKEKSEESEGEKKDKPEEKEGEGEEKKEGDKEEENKEKEGEEKEQDKPEEGEEKDDQKERNMKETQKRLEEMNISPEKARMILEAMKSNEVQYLQQKKRKQSKRSDNGLPDW